MNEISMKKIGILYICTGNYSVFWDDFYKTFSEKFCTNSELHFFVFSDKFFDTKNLKNIHYKKIDNLPWPLITLLRFNTFLSIEEDLLKMDYLFFFNSNMVCKETVSEEEFLPNEKEKLCFVQHPGYLETKRIFIPYDRNKKSTAYIPYKCGGKYVIGAVEGGESIAFLEMCKTLNENIKKDLKQNIIAKWHDESHINHFIYKITNFKMLSPSYCYPVGVALPIKNKISGVSKQDKFDVKNFKTVSKNYTIYQKVIIKLKSEILPYLLFLKSCLLFEEVK